MSSISIGIYRVQVFEVRSKVNSWNENFLTIQWPEEIYKETNIDLSNTTQNIPQKMEIKIIPSL
jgi:hypothetical protein